MYSNISITFQFTCSKTLLCCWALGWISRPLTEKLLSKDYKSMLLNSQSTFLSTNTDPLSFYTLKKATVITEDHVFKKWYWLRFPSPNTSRPKSLNKYLLYLDIISFQSVFLERDKFFLEMYESYSVRR